MRNMILFLYLKAFQDDNFIHNLKILFSLGSFMFFHFPLKNICNYHNYIYISM